MDALSLLAGWLRRCLSTLLAQDGNPDPRAKRKRVLVALLLLSVPLIVGLRTLLNRINKRARLPTRRHYDYIIVGGGTCGCVLASRLSEDPSVQVLLLEAGGDLDEANPDIAVPSRCEELVGTEVDWMYKIVPQRFTSNRSHVVHAGKVLGGSSSINRMVHSRGSTRDFTHLWDVPSWSWNDVQPYFSKIERRIPENNKEENTAIQKKKNVGPLAVTSPAYVSTATRAFLSAATMVSKENENQDEGIIEESPQSLPQVLDAGLVELNITERGRRCSAAVGYLTPSVRSRRNLTICTYARVIRLLFDGKSRITGVEYLSARDKYTSLRRVTCRRNGEVLVAAGGLGSPHLLLLSGIGPRVHLRNRGVPLIRNVPSVGTGLRDQLCFPIRWKTKRPLLFSGIETAKKESWMGYLDYKLFGRGPWSVPSVQASVLARSSVCDLPADIPDIQLLFFCELLPTGHQHSAVSVVLTEDHPTKPLYFGFTILVTLLHPKSEGSITMRSSSWRTPSYIDPHYLEHPSDMKVLLEGFRLARRIVAEGSFKEFMDKEIHEPGLVQKYDNNPEHEEYMVAYIRKHVTSACHPVGTCRMGEDSAAVVNSGLRVTEVDGLRVIDSSVLPSFVSGTVNATCIMLAEKASDIIKQDRRAPRNEFAAHL